MTTTERITMLANDFPFLFRKDRILWRITKVTQDEVVCQNTKEANDPWASDTYHWSVLAFGMADLVAFYEKRTPESIKKLRLTEEDLKGLPVGLSATPNSPSVNSSDRDIEAYEKVVEQEEKTKLDCGAGI